MNKCNHTTFVLLPVQKAGIARYLRLSTLQQNLDLIITAKFSIIYSLVHTIS